MHHWVARMTDKHLCLFRDGRLFTVGEPCEGKKQALAAYQEMRRKYHYLHIIFN